MAIVKTAELSGSALDWAVALALGKRPSLFIFQQTGALAKEHNYSTNWVQGGPIIDRMVRDGLRLMGYSCLPTDPTNCQAQIKGTFTGGSTPLIAAMRCYVASKLGDNVEIPNELL